MIYIEPLIHMRRYFSIPVLTILLLISAACAKDEPVVEKEEPEVVQEPDLTVLFVGNSLTYYNAMPELVKERAEQLGKIIAFETLAFANYGLEDHWNDGIVQSKIKTDQFDFVIIQQGPSSQAAGRRSLLVYGQNIKDLCVEHEAELAFYMVWPSRQYYHTFDGVIRNYSEAARSTNSLLCRVGSVWKSHFDSTNDFSYYGPDQFHPSLSGSQVAANVIASTLFAN